MPRMFAGAGAFNQSLDNWDVAQVTNMESMFDGAYAFNQPLANWNVSQVTDMGFMFSGVSSFDETFAIDHASVFNQNLCTWYTKITGTPNTLHMFDDSGCTDDSDPDFTTKASFCQDCSPASKPTYVVFIYLVFIYMALTCCLV